MCWITTHTVSVPATRTDARNVTFHIRVAPLNASASSVTIERPLAAFHALRTDLLRLTHALPTCPRGPRWMRRAVKKTTPSSSACTCEAPKPCPFANLHTALQALAPLPASASGFRLFGKNKGSHCADNDRFAVDKWLSALHTAFASGFSDALLQSKYQRRDCGVMNAYAAFLNAHEHFAGVDTSAMRRPLALRAWRAERDQAALDDISLLEDEDDEFNDASMPILVSAPEEVSADATPSLLPRLDVKRVGLATLQTFLEDFCDTILAQHGHDITELQSPELTMARRWELGLFVACRLGHSYGAQLILFYYADANVALDDGTTCLHIAARMGRPSIVSLLLQEGADVDEANDDGITPLMAACRNGYLDIAKLLIDAGADVGAASDRGTQALHAAIVSQKTDVVKLLIDAGANVRATTKSGLTPLHFAARVGSVEMSELLLRHNADPEQQTKSGSDALMIATTNGHVEICELFQKEMDRKHVLGSSGGKLFHRFKKPKAIDEAQLMMMRRRGESQEDANSVILMHQQQSTAPPASRRTIVV